MSVLKDIFQVLDHLVVLSRSAERKEAAATCLRDVTAEGGVISKYIKRIFQSDR